MCGVGGLGKTQVAVEYALQYRDQYTAVLMVNADTPESLRSGLAGLAGALYADLDQKTPDDVKEQKTLDWLQKYPGWLLIVDNADDYTARNAVVERLSQWADGHLLITARLRQWPQSIEALDLPVLSVEDGARFLLKATEGHRRVTPQDAEQAKQLAGEDLDGMCLAQTQAAAYITQREISFAEYRQRWAENLKEARTWADNILIQYHPDRKERLSVATTWLTTFQLLPPPSKLLLQMLSWLATAPIPQGLLTHPDLERQWQECRLFLKKETPVRGAKGSTTDLETALIPLRSYSLLTHHPGDPSDSAGRIHRVVQLITRDRLSDKQRRATLTAMLWAINNYTPTESRDVRNWPIIEPIRLHLMAMFDFANKAGIIIPTTRLISVMAVFLIEKGNFGEAESMARLALAIDEHHHGPDHPDVATDLNNLASLLLITNRPIEAETSLKRAIEIDGKHYGNKHPKVAERLNNLAQLYKSAERFNEAEPLMIRSLAIHEMNYDTDPSVVAIGLCNLAGLLLATDRLLEAEPLARRALAIDESLYGVEHPRVALDLNMLAQVCKGTNRIVEAEGLFRRALAIDERVYGTEHHTVANRLHNLGTCLKSMNRLGEAELLLHRSVAAFVTSLGPEHPRTNVARENYCLLLEAMHVTPAEIEAKLRGTVGQ